MTVHAENPSSTIRSTLGFRFVVAAMSLTLIAVFQVELERRTLLLRRSQTQLISAAIDAADQQNQREVELARLSAPQALLQAAAPDDGNAAHAAPMRMTAPSQ